MLDEWTDAMSVGDEPDVVYQYEQKLLADEKMAELRQQVEDKDHELEELKAELDHKQMAELRQQVEDKDHELEELKAQLDRTTDEYQRSLQRLTDAEKQVNDYN